MEADDHREKIGTLLAVAIMGGIAAMIGVAALRNVYPWGVVAGPIAAGSASLALSTALGFIWHHVVKINSNPYGGSAGWVGVISTVLIGILGTLIGIAGFSGAFTPISNGEMLLSNFARQLWEHGRRWPV
jgi:hypothetical protein